MSVFDLAKNNRGNDKETVTMSYKTFDEYLHKAQVEEYERLIAQIIAIGEREYHGGDYEYFYGVDALLEELSKDDR